MSINATKTTVSVSALLSANKELVDKVFADFLGRDAVARAFAGITSKEGRASRERVIKDSAAASYLLRKKIATTRDKAIALWDKACATNDTAQRAKAYPWFDAARKAAGVYLVEIRAIAIALFPKDKSLVTKEPRGGKRKNAGRKTGATNKGATGAPDKGAKIVEAAPQTIDKKVVAPSTPKAVAMVCRDNTATMLSWLKMKNSKKVIEAATVFLSALQAEIANCE